MIEERWLQFLVGGDDYRRYQRRTSAFVPLPPGAAE
jgi:steroid 5-alpha reductase family enzyme